MSAMVTATLCMLFVSCAKRDLAPGAAAIACVFEESPPVFKSPEGIALDQHGNLFVSLRTLEGRAITKNEIVRITPSGDRTTIADLGPVQRPGAGALGLAIDGAGNLDVAFASADERSGVYQVRLDGNSRHLPGSEYVHAPNAVAFDDRGNLYVTDCYPVTPDDPGMVWRGTPGGAFAVWTKDDLLAPDPLANPVSPPPPAMPFAAPGANGIVFVSPNHLYVANTEKCLILEIPVLEDGSAGKVRVVAGSYPSAGPPGLLFAPDGLAADTEGMLYTVVPPAGQTGPGFPLSPVLRIHPATGETEPVVEALTEPSPLFDFPTSLAIGIPPGETECIFVANMTGRAMGMANGSGPKVTRVRIGR